MTQRAEPKDTATSGFVEHLRRLVRRAVVDDNDLESIGGQRLPFQLVEQATKQRGAIPRGDADGDRRCWHASTLGVEQMVQLVEVTET